MKSRSLPNPSLFKWIVPSIIFGKFFSEKFPSRNITTAFRHPNFLLILNRSSFLGRQRSSIKTIPGVLKKLCNAISGWICIGITTVISDAKHGVRDSSYLIRTSSVSGIIIITGIGPDVCTPQFFTSFWEVNADKVMRKIKFRHKSPPSSTVLPG